MSEAQTPEVSATETNTETEKKRRKLRPNEVSMLKQFLEFADPGKEIRIPGSFRQMWK